MIHTSRDTDAPKVAEFVDTLVAQERGLDSLQTCFTVGGTTRYCVVVCGDPDILRVGNGTRDDRNGKSDKGADQGRKQAHAG